MIMNLYRIRSTTVLLFIFLSGVVLGQQKKEKAASFSLTDELKSLYDISLLPAYRENAPEAQVSTYDTTGGNDDGFNGKYSFLRKNADGSLVIFDMRGPGVINRIWTPTPTEDTLDFFIDGDSKPALSIKYLDLFSGKVYPFIQPLCGNQLGGYFCYFPILFQSHCMIVYRGKKTQFHQIQYRLYPPGSKVQAFHLNLDPQEKEGLDEVNTTWTRMPAAMPVFDKGNSLGFGIDSKMISIRPGETQKIFQSFDAGRIVGLTFERPTGFQWNKNIDIKITWDQESVPAVYCPIEDFFGYAFGKASMQSFLMGSVGQKDYCYFPMPYDQQVSIELIYRNGEGLLPAEGLKVTTSSTRDKRNPATEGKFYASWKSNQLYAKDGPHVFLDTKGKGHYVGSVLQARGLNAGMTSFFEGDDSTAVDGQPKLHGTGSEDYFNGGWYALLDRWDGKMSLPLHGALDYSLPFCRTGAYRFYLSDKISFEKAIFQSIEHGPVGNSVPAAYTSLALYYCSQQPASFVQPTNESTKLVIPDTLVLYPQLMKFSLAGDIHTRGAWAYNTGGESFVFTATGEALLSISLDQLPFKKYKLLADFVRVPDGGEFSIWQRQTQLTGWIGTEKATREREQELSLCSLTTSEFNNTLTVRIKAGQGPRTFFLNRFIFVRQD
jgi:Protein of unknown function (DUF2961)